MCVCERRLVVAQLVSGMCVLPLVVIEGFRIVVAVSRGNKFGDSLNYLIEGAGDEDWVSFIYNLQIIN